MQHTAPESARQWAIVELLGRLVVAGEVSEQAVAGRALLRVDVPEVSWTETEVVDGSPAERRRSIGAHTQLVGSDAIYRLTYVDEATALLTAHRVRSEPVKQWELRHALHQLTLHERRALLLPPAVDGDGDEPF